MFLRRYTSTGKDLLRDLGSMRIGDQDNSSRKGDLERLFQDAGLESATIPSTSSL